MDSAWERDDVQFARLLAAIHAIGLGRHQVLDLCVAMNVGPVEIEELFRRAEAASERLKTEGF